MLPPRLFAGSRTAAGYVDDFGEDARFNYPACMCTDGTYLYVTEYAGCRVRRVDPATAEVTTVATFSDTVPAASGFDNVYPAGAGTFGIARHEGSGKFFVACGHERKVYVFNPDWTPDTTLDTSGYTGAPRIWFVWPSDDGTYVYCAGNWGPPDETLVNQLYKIRLSDNNQMANLTVRRADIGPPYPTGTFYNAGGLIQIGSWIYWVEGRFEGRALWRVDLDLTVGSIELVLSFLPLTIDNYDSGRQLHLYDPTTLTVAFGPSDYTGETGPGAREIDLGAPAIPLSDPAPGLHADGTAPGSSAAKETDYLHAFGKHFVVSSAIGLYTGSEAWHALSGPHCIEIIGEDQGGWLVGAVGFQPTNGFGL